MRRLLLTAAAALTMASCHVQTVDVAQPIAAAAKFYSAFRAGDSRAALTQFAPEFVSQADNWPRLLDGLQQRYGPVTAVELQGSSLAASESGPCYSLTYAVKRGTLASTEILFLCSKGANSPWLIRGQELTRLDSQQSITGGVFPKEIGVHVP